MPFYQYRVTNSQGQAVVGTLQAESSDAAHKALSGSGYNVQLIQELKAATAAPVPQKSVRHVAPHKISTATPVSQPVIKRVSVESPSAGPVLNSIADSVDRSATHKTKKGRDKDLFFLFSQLGSYFRSGINPVQALGDLTNRTPERYHDSLKHAAQVVSEGGRMSDALEKYPYLYPPDVVGTVRAGETAGFLAEAMEEIGAKMELSHRLKRRLTYFGYIFAATIAITPMILGTVQGALASIKQQDTAGGELPVMATLGKAVGKSLLHDLPLTLLIFGSIWAFIAWFNSMPMRQFRHMIIIRTPVLGGRAMAESMARLTWAMGMVSRGGLSPQQTFLLGLQSVPNLFVQQKLKEEGQRMGESDKLSVALRRSDLLPVEYGNIVETGEVTGDVPRALEHVARATDADFQARNATAVTSSSFILYGILAVMITILAAWLLTAWYGGLIQAIPTDGSFICW